MFNPHEYYTQSMKIMQTNEPKFVEKIRKSRIPCIRKLAFFDALSVIYYLKEEVII